MRHFERKAILIFGWILGLAQIAGATDLPACGLLSAAEVEHIARARVVESRPQVQTETLTTCLYVLQGGGRITVLLRRHWDSAQAQGMARKARGGEFRTIGELGDRAFLLDMRDAGAALCIYRGEYYVQISAFHVASGGFPVAHQLAINALTRVGEQLSGLYFNVTRSSPSGPYHVMTSGDAFPFGLGKYR